MPIEKPREPTRPGAHGRSRKIALCPAVFCMTPEWHQARARFLRWLDEPKARYWARQHENLGGWSSTEPLVKATTTCVVQQRYPPRLSGSFISRGLPNGSEVRECLPCRKTASCDLMESP